MELKFFPLFFFFQAEDGIRDLYVTGVQTCALPISSRSPAWPGLSPLGGAAPAGAAKEPTAPASSEAVSPSCHMKPSRARSALARTCAERGRSPAELCAANRATCLAVSEDHRPASACAATNGRTWDRSEEHTSE